MNGIEKKLIELDEDIKDLEENILLDEEQLMELRHTRDYYYTVWRDQKIAEKKTGEK